MSYNSQKYYYLVDNSNSGNNDWNHSYYVYLNVLNCNIEMTLYTLHFF